VKTDNVYPIGFVPLEDMPALYSSAEAFVYPSLYEGFGLPVLEAMSCETPVVTSNRSSLPEVAGEAAVLVNPLSADEIAVGIKTAMKDRAILTRKGLVQAQKFSWDKTAKETLAVYNQALLLNNGK
ncbi:MAG: Glycosyl transferase group 1, partial [Microgenomates group bacterium GW2011_GWA2_44_7]